MPTDTALFLRCTGGNRMRERRRYTMSQQAIEQRRVAAKRPKKKKISANNWKHGQYAKTPVTVLKPCLSSCVKYPCDKVQDFTTKAGDLCFSDDGMFRFYTVLVKAVHKKETEGFYDAAAYLIANSMAILDKLMEEVLNNGTTISREKFNTMGDVVGQDMISHPNLLNIGKLLQSLNLNLSEFLLTPLSRAKIDQGKEGISTIAELLSNIGQKLSLPKRTLMESHQGNQ